MTAWDSLARRAVDEAHAAQDPHELALLLTYLDTVVAPESVLEIGGFRGGSRWAWAQLREARLIVTVEADPRGLEPPIPGTMPKQVVIPHVSQSPPAQRAAQDWRPDGGYDLVFIDADHRWPAALSDFCTYAPMAARWGLVVLHDTQDYPGREDHQVSVVWEAVRSVAPTTELVSHRGGPFGTGIIWPGDGDSWWSDTVARAAWAARARADATAPRDAAAAAAAPSASTPGACPADSGAPAGPGGQGPGPA